MSNRFEGWYFKHQTNGKTLALIPGRSVEGAFIQVITGERAHDVHFSAQTYRKGGANVVEIAGNAFSREGVRLDIHADGLALAGELTYGPLTPLRSDIMGPFRFLPMECRHTVVSMRHQLSGTLILNGAVWDFSGGRGYIEGDSGRSFPDRYLWVQCNAFEDCAIMASAARIPFTGLRFWGCICAVWLRGREVRLATYLGARIVSVRRDRLEITQGRTRLIVEIFGASGQTGHALSAPETGVMRRVIREHPACTARFVFTDGDAVLFDRISNAVSFEFEA